MSRLPLALVLAACHGTTSTPSTPDPTTPDAATADYVHDVGLEGAPFTLDDPACTHMTGYTYCQDVVYSVVDSYAGTPDYGLKLDIYAPDIARTQKVPALLYIHGGGWLAGSNHEVMGDYLNYVQQGYIVASVEYRLTAHPYPTLTGVSFPQNLQDVKTAVRWLRVKAGALVDSDRIISYGFSAGAHLSSMVATTSDIPEFEGRGDPAIPSTVKAAVGLSTPLDFHLFEPSNPPLSPQCPPQPPPQAGGTPAIGVALLIGTDPNDWTSQVNNPMLDTVSAMHYLDANDAPMMIFYGTCDQVVPYMGGEEMVALSQQVGAHVTGFESPMAMHSGTLGAPGAKDALAAFLATQLGQ